MTDEQINKTIAEYVGHKNISIQTIGEDIGMPMSFLFSGEPNKGGYAIPDYCNDLNAMHEAEKILFTTNNWDACAYEYVLQKETTSWAWHSTAKQRAEAFLKTICKWEE